MEKPATARAITVVLADDHTIVRSGLPDLVAYAREHSLVDTDVRR